MIAGRAEIIFCYIFFLSSFFFRRLSRRSFGRSSPNFAIMFSREPDLQKMVRNVGVPPKNINISTRFRTTLRLDREYRLSFDHIKV